jgi:magnesium chelatase family protein
MTATVATVAYLGLEARPVEVQVQLSAGLPRFTIVGLPDKAVAESRERVHAALASIGLALPPKRITVNLSPADLPKEGSHFDLPIALCLLAAIGAADADALSHYVIVGELKLDGRIAPSPGVLLAAIQASSEDKGLICPVAQGAEAAWAGSVEVIAAPDLLASVRKSNHQGKAAQARARLPRNHVARLCSPPHTVHEKGHDGSKPLWCGTDRFLLRPLKKAAVVLGADRR